MWRRRAESNVGGVKKLLALAATLAAAVAVGGTGTASAGWYFKTDDGQWGWLGPGLVDDPNCIWYRGRAACSGWNYWHWNYIERQRQWGTILLGFENYERIRGKFIGEFETSDIVWPSMFSMGGYLVSHGTWWEGSSVVTRLHTRY